MKRCPICNTRCDKNYKNRIPKYLKDNKCVGRKTTSEGMEYTFEDKDKIIVSQDGCYMNMFEGLVLKHKVLKDKKLKKKLDKKD